VATGERLACRIMVASLKNEVRRVFSILRSVIVLTTFKGIDAELVSLIDIVAEAFGPDLHKQIAAYDELGSRFFHVLASKIGEKLEACGNKVPVVTGQSASLCRSLLLRLVHRLLRHDATLSSPKRWTGIL
jgi:hypothetical protein